MCFIKSVPEFTIHPQMSHLGWLANPRLNDGKFPKCVGGGNPTGNENDEGVVAVKKLGEGD